MTKNSAVPAKAGGLLPYLRKEERKGRRKPPFFDAKNGGGCKMSGEIASYGTGG